jgi:hypothetical protein
VVTQDVPAHVFVAHEPAKPIAHVAVPLTKAETMDDFVRGLSPIRRRSPGAPQSEGDSSKPASFEPRGD